MLIICLIILYKIINIINIPSMFICLFLFMLYMFLIIYYSSFALGTNANKKIINQSKENTLKNILVNEVKVNKISV